MQWGVNNSTKPWVVWRMIENWEVADIKIYNEQMEFIIPKVVEAFAAGPPLYGTFLPDKAPVELDVI